MMQPHERRAGFNILELLIVMAIVAFLSGLILTAIHASSGFASRATARHETRTIELGWKQYYAHYQRWPEGLLSDADGAICIKDDVVAMLQGTLERPDAPAEGEATPTSLFEQNPDRLRFVEFQRYDEDGDPVNPFERDDCYFYVRFDDDFDNWIDLPGDGDQTNRIARSVIVWTRNPRPKQNDPESAVIGSWMD
jgi:prepilin-type N-terminal cleavage/methylation domain-containing protein